MERKTRLVFFFLVAPPQIFPGEACKHVDGPDPAEPARVRTDDGRLLGGMYTGLMRAHAVRMRQGWVQS